MATTIDRKLRRKRKVRMMITGTKDKPRLSVFRSNKYMYIQAFDDVGRVTVAAYSNMKSDKKLKKTEDAREVGKNLGKLLLEKGVKMGVFDRGQYAYKGRVKAVAEGLREAGLLV